jgi:hypothetical protein
MVVKLDQTMPTLPCLDEDFQPHWARHCFAETHFASYELIHELKYVNLGKKEGCCCWKTKYASTEEPFGKDPTKMVMASCLEYREFPPVKSLHLVQVPRKFPFAPLKNSSCFVTTLVLQVPRKPSFANVLIQQFLVFRVLVIPSTASLLFGLLVRDKNRWHCKNKKKINLGVFLATRRGRGGGSFGLLTPADRLYFARETATELTSRRKNGKSST